MRRVVGFRSSLLLGSAITGIVAMGVVAAPAQAQSIPNTACGPLSDVVVCPTSGNDYEDGIDYRTPGTAPAPVDLTVVLEDGVEVDLDPASGAIAGVLVGGANSAPVTIEAAGSLVQTSGLGQAGVVGVSQPGTGTGAVRISAGDVVTSGPFSPGVYAYGTSADVTVGTVSTTGISSVGVYAYGTTGPVSVTLEGGIRTTGPYSDGIVANSGGGGPVSVTVAGDIAVYDGLAVSVSTSGDATVLIEGDVGAGDNRFTPGGAINVNAGTAHVTNNGSVYAAGQGLRGIRVIGTGDVTIDGTGSVVTNGYNAHGITASSLGDVSISQESVTVLGDADAIAGVGLSTGSVSINVGTATAEFAGPTASFNPTIYARSSGGSISVNAGTVSSLADSADGIFATNTGGSIEIAAGNVSTAGYEAEGIWATTTGDGTIDIAVSGEITTTGGRAEGVYAGVDLGSGYVQVGSITTSGDNARGVEAHSNGGDLTVVATGSIVTSGENSRGVNVFDYSRTGTVGASVADVTTYGDGAVGVSAVGGNAAVEVNGTVETFGGVGPTGYNARGVTVGGYSGAAVVYNNGTVITHGDGAEGIYARGAAGVLVTGAGDVRTFGDGAIGISAASYGPVAVEAGSVETAGVGSVGIGVQSGSDAGVSFESIVTQGDGASGLVLTSQGSQVGVLGGTVSTEGYAADGVNVIARNGVANVALTGASVSGDNASVLRIDAGAAVVGLTGTITSTGDQSGALPGAIAITTTEVPGVDGADGSVTIGNDATIETEGLANMGFNIEPAGDVLISGDGSVTTAGAGATGIRVRSTSDITIDQASVTTTGRAYGVHAFTSGDIAITLDSATAIATDPGATVFDNNSAIYAGYGRSATIDVGTVTAVGDYNNGITVYDVGDAVINAGEVSTSGYQSNAIQVYGTGYTRTVAIDVSGDITAQGDGSRGIVARPSSADIAISAHNITTDGDSANGVSASGRDIDILIDGDVTTSGDFSRGVFAIPTAGYAANVVVTGTITTDGLRSEGFYSRADGSVAADIGAIETLGTSSSGAVLIARENVSIDVGSVSTAGDNSFGIYAMGMTAIGGTDSAVDVTAGQVVTTGDAATGVVAIGLGDSTVNVDVGSIQTAGTRAHGLLAALDSTGTATIQVEDITTASDQSRGILAVALNGPGEIEITSTGNISTAGADAQGVFARADAGSVDITVNNVMTTGAGSDGVRANAYETRIATTGLIATSGDGSHGIYSVSNAAEINVGGSINTTGEDSDGVRAFGDAAAVTVSGAVRATGVNSAGVYVSTDSSSLVRTTQSGSIYGTDFGVIVESNDIVAIENAGTISSAPGGLSLLLVSDGSAIDNSGTISGAIALSDGDDQFANSGTLAITGDSDFGAGDDVLANTGTVSLNANLGFGTGDDLFANAGVLRALGGAGTTRALTGLETLQNSGTISLVNGVAGNILSTNGDYVGANGRLALEVSAGISGAAADRFDIGGSASGSTTIGLSFLDNAPALNSGLTLVTVGGASSASTFALDGAHSSRGLVQYALLFDAAAGTYSLTGGPNETAYRLLNVTSGALNVAQGVSDDLIRQFEVTGAGDGLWLQMGAHSEARDSLRSFTAFGNTKQVALDYSQDRFGGQVGYGFGFGGATVGLTGGYQSSKLRDAGFGRAAYDMWNAGGYAAFDLGPLSAQVAAHYDWYEVGMRSLTGGYDAENDGTGWGAKAQLGARLGSDMLWFEPRGGISYARVDLGEITVGGVTADFVDAESLRSNLGLTVGGGSKVKLYASGDWVHEFKGKDGIDFRSGGTVLGYDNLPVGDFGRGRIGFTTTSGGVTGFIEAEGVMGRDYSGGGARVGIRLGF